MHSMVVTLEKVIDCITFMCMRNQIKNLVFKGFLEVWNLVSFAGRKEQISIMVTFRKYSDFLLRLIVRFYSISAKLCPKFSYLWGHKTLPGQFFQKSPISSALINFPTKSFNKIIVFLIISVHNNIKKCTFSDNQYKCIGYIWLCVHWNIQFHKKSAVEWVLIF